MAKRTTSQDLVEACRQELIAEARIWRKTESWQTFPAFDKPEALAMADLEHTWQAIAEGAGPPMVPALAEFRTWHPDNYGEPLDALALFVEQGHYPPPELLLAVVRMYQTYVDSEGQRTLEECFFGKPKPKAGNHAARKARSLKELGWTIRVAVAGEEAGGDIHAAEEIVKHDDLDIDPESVLRAVNKRSRRIKPEK